jgi:hypothetical protein
MDAYPNSFQFVPRERNLFVVENFRAETLLVPPLLEQFPFRIALRSSVFEEPSLYAEPNEDEYWHQRKDEQDGQHMMLLPLTIFLLESRLLFFLPETSIGLNVNPVMAQKHDLVACFISTPLLLSC